MAILCNGKGIMTQPDNAHPADSQSDPQNPFAAPDPVQTFEWGIESPPDIDGYPVNVYGPYDYNFASRMCAPGTGNTLLERIATTSYTDWSEVTP